MAAIQIDEGALTRGQLRKLNALRKSIGEELGEKAFAEWLASKSAAAGAAVDGSATLIVDTLWPMVQQGTLAIPRGGYLIRCRNGARHLPAPFEPVPMAANRGVVALTR